MIRFTAIMVRTLKGAPLSVLIGLIVARQDGLGVVGAEWLERNTGYSDKPVTQALAFLEEQGMVSRNGRYGWQLTGDFIQLPLSVADLPENVVNGDNDRQPGSAGCIQLETRKNKRSRRNSESSPSSSSRDSKVKLTDQLLQQPECDPENFRVNLETLRVVGIAEPKRSHLAEMPHVTQELIQYHTRKAASIGLAIYRIEHDFPIEAEVKPEEGRRKYIDGEYAAFIEH